MNTAASLAIAALLLVSSVPVRAQKVSNPSASVLDVSARQTFLKSTTDPRVREAVSHLGSCTHTPFVPAPTGQMQIPHHYMQGSNGPINPAEAEATRAYAEFERRTTAGMNQWVATDNQVEAQCALSQLDAWAQAGALTRYDPKAYSQSWYQAEWTLASAGITASVLRQDADLDGAQQERVANWLDSAAHKLISYEKHGELGNNHHYWRALAAMSIGVLSNDNDLFRFGVDTFKEAVGQEDANGAFPLEMARHENAIHYQAFALQPLIMIAEFAERQNVHLYSYTEHGHTIRDAIVFLGRAVADPAVVKQYTQDPQKMSFHSGTVAELEFYFARFGTAGIPPSLTEPSSRARERHANRRQHDAYSPRNNADREAAEKTMHLFSPPLIEPAMLRRAGFCSRGLFTARRKTSHCATCCSSSSRSMNPTTSPRTCRSCRSRSTGVTSCFRSSQRTTNDLRVPVRFCSSADPSLDRVMP